MRARAILGGAVFALALGCSRGGAPSGPPMPRPVNPPNRSGGANPSIGAPRVTIEAFRADGVLDEPFWRRAGFLGGFVNPTTGRPDPNSKVNGEARVVWCEQGLLLGIDVRDTDPQTPFPRDAVDPHLWERSSGVELMLQPGSAPDNLNYVEVQIAPNGARWTSRFADYNLPAGTNAAGERTFGEQAWDCCARRGGRVVPNAGYIVEFLLPWADLVRGRAPQARVPPQPGDIWKMNVYTFRDGQRDALAWSPILGRGNFHRASRFGLLRFEP